MYNTIAPPVAGRSLFLNTAHDGSLSCLQEKMSPEVSPMRPVVEGARHVSDE